MEIRLDITYLGLVGGVERIPFRKIIAESFSWSV